MNNTLKRLLSVAAFGTCAFNATAGLVTDSTNFNFGSISFYDYSFGSPNSLSAEHSRSQYLFLDGFDSSLGTLTGVNISFQSQYNLSAKVSATDVYDAWLHTDSTSGTARAASTMTVDLINPNGPTSNTYRSVTTGCSNSSYSYPSCSSTNTSSSYFNDSINVSGIDFSQFLDTTVTLKIDQLLSALITSCDSDSKCYGWSTNNQWTGNVSVAYTFSEFTASVSEPGTLALLGLGLVGLGISRRKAQA